MTGWSYFASGFGLGYAPRAPGTLGALLGLFLGALLLHLGHAALLFGIIGLSALGVYSVSQLQEASLDPGWVVIDEVVGQMIPLLALAHVGLRGLILSFALFRLFDIWKPGPVGWADARHDALGVMGDDVIAGLLALAVVLAVRLLGA